MESMAYTVRQVAGLSGVSARTLHFYDEVALLKPAYVSASGYRYYEEPQLLMLQQILFYRELGLELKKSRAFWAGPISRRRPRWNHIDPYWRQSSPECKP